MYYGIDEDPNGPQDNRKSRKNGMNQFQPQQYQPQQVPIRTVIRSSPSSNIPKVSRITRIDSNSFRNQPSLTYPEHEKLKYQSFKNSIYPEYDKADPNYTSNEYDLPGGPRDSLPKKVIQDNQMAEYDDDYALGEPHPRNSIPKKDQNLNVQYDVNQDTNFNYVKKEPRDSVPKRKIEVDQYQGDYVQDYEQEEELLPEEFYQPLPQEYLIKGTYNYPREEEALQIEGEEEEDYNYEEEQRGTGERNIVQSEKYRTLNQADYEPEYEGGEEMEENIVINDNTNGRIQNEGPELQDEYCRYIFEQINLLRKNPAGFVGEIENAKPNIGTTSKGQLVYVGDNVKVALNRGEEAFDEAKEELSQIGPMPPLTYLSQISVQPPANDAELKDKNYLPEEIKRLQAGDIPIKSFWKDIVKDPNTAFLLSIIDDGGKQSGKRKDLLDPEMKYIGLSSAKSGNGKHFACFYTLAK